MLIVTRRSEGSWWSNHWEVFSKAAGLQFHWHFVFSPLHFRAKQKHLSDKHLTFFHIVFLFRKVAYIGWGS